MQQKQLDFIYNQGLKTKKIQSVHSEQKSIF